MILPSLVNPFIIQSRYLSLTPALLISNQKWPIRRPVVPRKWAPRPMTRLEFMRKVKGMCIANRVKFDTSPPVNALEKCADDEPLHTNSNPYIKARPSCILCKYGVHLDYKNTRLLSQFISSFSGRLYEQHVTGLCMYQYEHLRVAIIESRRAGLMPVMSKNPRYLKDPRLFDAMRPIKPNSV